MSQTSPTSTPMSVFADRPSLIETLAPFSLGPSIPAEVPTREELREIWRELTCRCCDLYETDSVGCLALETFDSWFDSLLASAYDRGYSDGFDGRG